MFKQQMLGVIRLSLPLIILFNIAPAFCLDSAGQIACSVMLGTYIWYLNWVQLKSLNSSLHFNATGHHKNLFRDLIRECGVNPETILIKYAHCNDSMAMAADNIIIIDPRMWPGLEEEPEAVKAKNVLEAHLPLSPVQQKRYTEMSNALTPGVQRFIFKHELGHIFYNFSSHKLAVIFGIGTLATYSGLFVAAHIYPYNGLAAALAGMTVGGVNDLLLTLASNIVWKLNEEKKADLFAAQYSSYEDILEAADFFEKHQEIFDANQEPTNFLDRLPSEIKSGHPNGKPRAAYLRELAELKKLQA